MRRPRSWTGSSGSQGRRGARATGRGGGDRPDQGAAPTMVLRVTRAFPEPARRVGRRRLPAGVEPQAHDFAAPDRDVLVRWHLASRSLSGSPGRTTLARSVFAPCIAAWCVRTSHTKPCSVHRSPTWISIGKTVAEPASGSRAAEALAGRYGGFAASPLHSMTWSARASSDGGIVRPRVLAVLRFITKSNLVGCSTGRLCGLAPFRMRST